MIQTFKVNTYFDMDEYMQARNLYIGQTDEDMRISHLDLCDIPTNGCNGECRFCPFQFDKLKLLDADVPNVDGAWLIRKVFWNMDAHLQRKVLAQELPEIIEVLNDRKDDEK